MVPKTDCEEAAQAFAKRGFALRAGLHCAPLAHESAGTLQTGTLRLSTGWNTTEAHLKAFLRAAEEVGGDYEI
jgi:selenocysteine lyase/cysteine desulfurase